jgi:RNA polymerase sigma-70 factor (ECF subfamily)
MKDNRITDEDHTLVTLCKKGDADAFEALVKKNQKRMLNISFRMIGSYEDACEVVQDAFVNAYQSMKQFEGKAKFSTWLCTIVMNLSKNRLAQLKIRHQRESVSMDDPISADDSTMNRTPASEQPSALARLEQRDIQKKVQECIDSLDSEFREVLILRDMQGFSYDEIHGMLEIPEGTVKSRLSRARLALRDCLKNIRGAL